jgi:hypothetical protein
VNGHRIMGDAMLGPWTTWSARNLYRGCVRCCKSLE